MLQQICYLICLFFIYSVGGWCMEVILKYIQYHRFINRGFLQGPYCPIYGAGVGFITIVVWALTGVESSVGTTFVISFVACGGLEYFVSYYMEKRFHARWWDYSQKPMNLNGRIWIGNLVLFGIGGTVAIELINPVIYRGLDRLSVLALYVISALIVALMATDYTFTHFIMKLVKVGVEQSQADNTEDVGKEIYQLMTDKSLFHSRLIKAYPEVVYYTERIEQQKREREEKVARLKEDLSHQYELFMANPLVLRDEVIDLQGQLIDALSAETRDGEHIAALEASLAAARKRVEEQNQVFRFERSERGEHKLAAPSEKTEF